MKTLRTGLIIAAVITLAIGYTSYAYPKTASCVTHATIVILPRQEEIVLVPEELAEPSIGNEKMSGRIARIDTPYGEKAIYTIVGAL